MKTPGWSKSEMFNLKIKRLNHFAIIIPSGQEDVARKFYGKIFNLKELPKPQVLSRNGGIWFELPNSMQLHLTVQDDHDPNTSKCHLAYEVDSLEDVILVLRKFGIEFSFGQKIPNYKRINIRDPFGNKIELMQRI